MSTKGIDGYMPFEDYKKMTVPPAGLPAFTITNPDTENATTELIFGELFCRFDIAGSACGSKFQSTGALATHVKKAHSVKASVGGNAGRSGKDKANQAKVWFGGIMATHKNLAPPPPPTPKPEAEKPKPAKKAKSTPTKVVKRAPKKRNTRASAAKSAALVDLEDEEAL